MSKPYDGPWVLRSLLFVPGHNEKMMRKAADTGADCVVFDLEDAVPPEEKIGARAMIRSLLDQGVFARKTVFVRVNPIETDHYSDDLEKVACDRLHGFVYPMAGTTDEIEQFDRRLGLIENRLGLNQGHFSVIVLVETPEGVLNSKALAEASERTVGLMFGCEDYLAELQGRHEPDDIALLQPRSMVAMAARAAGIEPIDSPFVRVHDLEGLRRFAERGRDLGMAGMVVLAPRQLPKVHEIYTPSLPEVAVAQEIVKAAEETRRERKGIAVIDGLFISPPTLKAARKTLARLDAIRNIEMFTGSST